MYDIYHFLFVKGGPVMYPIVLGSILALALFLERVWSLRRERVIPPYFQRRLRVLLRERKLSEAEVLCQENGSALANVVASALDHAGEDRATVKEAVTEVGRHEVAHLERYVEFLGTIAAVEPLMGLLGTVTGLIRAFQKVEALAVKGGGVNPGALAAGIWEALIHDRRWPGRRHSGLRRLPLPPGPGQRVGGGDGGGRASDRRHAR